MKPIVGAFVILAASTVGAHLAQNSAVPKNETDLAQQMQMAAKYGPGYLALAPTQKLGNAWCLAPWSGDALPYEQTRREIETRFGRQGYDMAREVRRLRSVAEATPESPLAQFRWVFATNLEASKLSERGDAGGRIDFDEAGRMRWALALAPDPHVAEYARLRFSVESSRLSPNEARPLARRLARRWPNDRAIKFSTARMLINSRVAPDFDEAIRIADTILATAPNRASYVALKSTVHQRAWFRLYRRQDGLAAIEWHDRYARLFPQGSTDKEALGRIMDYIRKQLDGKIPIVRG